MPEFIEVKNCDNEQMYLNPHHIASVTIETIRSKKAIVTLAAADSEGTVEMEIFDPESIEDLKSYCRMNRWRP